MTFEVKKWEGEEVKSAGLCFLDLIIYSYVMVIITHKMQFHHLPQSPSSSWPVNPICDRARAPHIKRLPVFLPPDFEPNHNTDALESSGVPWRVPARDPENNTPLLKCHSLWISFLLSIFDQKCIFLKCHADTHLHNDTLLCTHVYRTHECGVCAQTIQQRCLPLMCSKAK